MARKQSRYNGNRNGGKVITKCEDTQPRQVFEIGDNIWVKIHESSWWPAQVVDKNALGGSNEINDGEEGKVLARLYGSYEYLYVDPMKYRSEFQNILKQHNNSVREILQKALEQDLSQIKIGAKLKGKASQSEENAKPKASKDTNGKRVCLKRKQEPLDAIGQRTRGKWNRLLENKAGDRAKEGKMTMHEEVQVSESSPTADVPTDNTVGEANKNLYGGIKGTHREEEAADKKSQEDKILKQNSAKKKQKPSNSESDVQLYESSQANKMPDCGRIKKTHEMECAGEQSQEDQTSKKDGVKKDHKPCSFNPDMQVKDKSRTADVPTENTVGKTNKKQKHGAIKKTHKADNQDCKSVDKASKNIKQDGAKKEKQADMVDLAKQLNPDEAKQQQKTEESVEKSLCRVSKNLKRGGVKKKQEADRLVTANQLKKDGFTRKQKPATLSLENGLKQGRVKEQQKDDKLCFANGVGQDKVKKKQKGDTPNSLSMQRYLSTEHTVTETSASPRQGGHERKRKAEKLDIVSVSETSKSLRQDGRKRKKAADKLDTVTVSGTSRSLRKNARKQEADTPNSAAVNEASESLSQDVSKRKKVADKPDSVTVSGTSRSLRKDGYKRKQAAEKPDAITVSKSSKSLRKDGPKGKQETHKPDTITVNGTSKTPRRDGCDRKHETDKPDTANDLKHSEDVNEKSKSTSSNLANSLLKGCQELSARRTKVMQSLGLVAPSGSPFSKVVLSKS